MSSTGAVFFSYAREDSAFALRLAKDLRDAGHPVWIDQLDIPAGTRWDTAVETALQAAPTMLVILSPTSVTSSNVMDEVSYAVEEGRRVIPILLAPCKVPFRLRRLQHVDFTGDYDRALQLALRDFPKRLSATVTSITDEQIAAGTAPIAPTVAPTVAPTPAAKSAPPPSPKPAPADREPGPRRKLAPMIGVLAVGAVGWIFVVKPWLDRSNRPIDGSVPSAARSDSIAPSDTSATPTPETAENAAPAGGADSNSSQQSVEAAKVPPVAAFDVAPASGPAPLQIRVTNRSTGQITRNEWDFGDGASSISPQLEYQYSTPGTYTIRLKVIGPNGSTTAEKRVTAKPRSSIDLRIDFGRQYHRGPAPMELRLAARAAVPVTDYMWTFGDGTTGTGPNVVKRYDQVGEYNIRVVAVTTVGSFAADEKVYVDMNESPVNPLALSDRFFRVRARSRENECLDSSPNGSGPLKVKECQAWSGQFWKFVNKFPISTGITTQFGENSGLCLETNYQGAGSVYEGAMYLAACKNSPSQGFTLTQLPDGYFRIHDVSSRCLAANLPGKVNLTGPAFMETCSTSITQQWKFEAP